MSSNLKLMHLRQILGLYRNMDRMIKQFQSETGIRCPSLCGNCCESQEVEATVPECLPLGNEIFRRSEAERVLSVIEERMDSGDARCVLFVPETGFPGKGRCGYYLYRPLVCRLFGVSGRITKYGRRELCLCRVIKTERSEILASLEARLTHRFTLPVYQESFERIAALHPGLGYRLLPINRAVKESLEHLYWKRPRSFRYRRAA